MALRVWLPLNGNINNQGLSSIVPSGTPTFLDDGKMGKCISLTPRVSFTGLPRLDNFTILFWLKVDSCSSDWADSLSFTSKQADDSSASPFRFEATKTSRACSFHNNTPYAITQGSRILITNEQKGEWHHCGFSYDGEHCYTYVDGKLIYVDTGLGGYLIDYFHIGETNNMVGGMNDLRIYDECLSQKQIKEISKGLVAHYKLEGIGANPNLATNTSTGSPNGYHDYTGKATVSRIKEDGVCTSTYKIDFPADDATYSNYNLYVNVPRNSLAPIQDGRTYTLSFKIKASKALSNYKLFYEYNNNAVNIDIGTKWQKVTITGVANNQYSALYVCHGGRENRLKINGGSLYIAEIKLELGETATDWIPDIADSTYTALGYDNMIAKDTSGNGYNGTISGALSYNVDSPRYSGSTNFSAPGYIHYLPSPINSSTDAFTFSCWFYPTQNATMALYNDRTVVEDGFSVFYMGSGIRFDTGASAQFQSGTIAVNAWNFVACVFDKNNNIKKTYINGIQVGSASTIGSLANVGSNASIGNSSTNGAAGAGNQIYGSLSDVRIYATALTTDDILTLYKTSGIVDNKGNVYAYEFKEE